MTGKLFIDGIDAYTAYKVYVGQGGYNDIASFPALKPFETNDWPDENGIEPDLAEPALDTREVSIMFFGGDVEGFVEMLMVGAYHEWNFAEIGLTKTLRLVSNESYNDINGLRHFSLRLADDYPLEGYEYSAPNKTGNTNYSIDDIDLGDYGITILQGSSDEVNKKAPVKKNLIVSLSKKAGINYDGYAAYRSSKDVNINCLMRCSVADFWHNYNALIYDLTRPYVRIFRGENQVQECYYGGCEVSQLMPRDGGVWCVFDLKLVFTMKDIEIVPLLATENGYVIETEDGIYLIDMKKNG